MKAGTFVNRLYLRQREALSIEPWWVASATAWAKWHRQERVCPEELSEPGTVESRVFVYGEKGIILQQMFERVFSFPLASLLCSKGSFCCVFMLIIFFLKS